MILKANDEKAVFLFVVFDSPVSGLHSSFHFSYVVTGTGEDRRGIIQMSLDNFT